MRYPLPGAFFKLVIFLILSAAACFAEQPSSAPSPPQLVPVPKSLEQGKVDRPLREKYKAEFASRDPKERGALGRKLREEADKETDATAKFVRLREARDLSVDAGDFSYAVEVIDDIAATFTIDAQDMKQTALMAGVDKSRVAPDDLARSYIKVCDDSLAIWNTDLAKKAAFLATKVAVGNRDLLAEAKERGKIANLRNRALLAAIAANQKLAKTPDDPGANQVLGAHVCFNLNRWDIGLRMLVKSPAGTLKSLAERDLATPQDPAAMAALADGWWDFGEAKAGLAPGIGRRRSAYWYAKALPGLTGEKKAQAEKRIAEIGEPPKP